MTEPRIVTVLGQRVAVVPSKKVQTVVVRSEYQDLHFDRANATLLVLSIGEKLGADVEALGRALAKEG